MGMLYLCFMTFLLCILSVSIEASAELTSGSHEQTQQNSQAGGGSFEAQCFEKEEKFREFVLGSLEVGLTQHRNAYNCLSGAPTKGLDCEKFKSNAVSDLRAYRGRMQKLYQEMGNRWMEDSKKNAQDIVRSCYENENGGVDLMPDVTKIKRLRGGFDCPKEENSWRVISESMSREFMSGKFPLNSLNASDVSKLNDYHKSPIGQALSNLAKYNKGLTDSELKSTLASGYNNVVNGIAKFKKSIGNLHPHQLYKLYSFESQFGQFLGTLKSQDQELFKRCRANSGMFANCNNDNQVARCLDQLWGFGLDMVPIVGAVNAITMLDHTRAGSNAGVFKEEEVQLRNTQAMIAGTLSMAGTVAGAGALANLSGKAVTEKAATSASSTRIAGAAKRYTDDEIRALQFANRGLAESNPAQWAQKISQELGVTLTDIQTQGLLRIHNLACPTSKCTAQQIRDLKDLAGLKKLFPDVDPEKLKNLYKLNLLGRDGYPMHINVNVRTAGANAWEASLSPIHGHSQAAREVAEGRLSVQGFENRMVSVAQSFGRYTDRPMEQASAYILSSERNKFMLGVKEAGEARQLMDYLAMRLRNSKVTVRGQTYFPHQVPRVSGPPGTVDLSEFTTDRYIGVIQELSKKFNLPAPSY